MTSEELSMWKAYENIEPFGEVRADLRAALICSVLANVNRGKNTKPFTTADFMLNFDKVYLEAVDSVEVTKKAQIQNVMAVSAPKGAIRVYEGDAPPIRKLGKRGKSAKSGRRKF